jgi:hypothetical protein
MQAVYLFEEQGNLGKDATSNALDLISEGTPSRNGSEQRQGLWSLDVDGGGALEQLWSNAAELKAATGASLTWGGWMWLHASSVPSDGGAIAQIDGSGGFALEWEDSSSLGSCIVIDAGGFYTAETTQTWDDNTEWVHFVCRFDNTGDQLAVFRDGTSDGIATSVMDISPAAVPFELSHASARYDGLMDEVFIVPRALSDAAIQRIWACGIEGSLCECNPDDPTSYTSCGRASGSCGALPACNATEP